MCRRKKTDDGNEQRGKVQFQQGGSLGGRAKVINGGVGGGNPPLACLMSSYVTVTEQGFFLRVMGLAHQNVG